ncbi:M20/M25/M40 family metallo-hydrolase [Arenibacter sp. GZD96]|uniref:M20/M25/M40 family metallo-hydrolase n=1 Tax=Aurantibrevibacter litoralis TaxID=3106030 RepID=UPI002AFE2494|nr:M20/M25/M40 family metallo-hydrolase [Arenibacter sp. GZD-96]MEA1787575.1 M20/M25/M40 family metallo-hydrolase [Arenibacter sp. GZD-96]
MKNKTAALILLFLILAIYWGFRSAMPVYKNDKMVSEALFSTDRAMVHVKNMSQEPHAVGFPGHKAVRAYLVSELKKLGLEPTLQEGYTAGDWGNVSKAINIMARIKGSGNGKALVLLSHYDSNPHSSFGASDAGSGVATILEGIRAFIAEGKTPKNDIIVLFTDAEELGLNGADLFVSQHPWAKEVGLVLNFEARGSGGPGYMLMETNRGNAKLIAEFTKANPQFPVANSLAYSIYKMLPNDTDLTVFREDRDIEGFNFAFIDDHFDYHTAHDSYDRLDKNTLAHQGSYLMPLLAYFSTADLSDMKSLKDEVYFNFPFFGLVSYSFDLIIPLFWLAVVFFIVLLGYGFFKKKLKIKEVALGFLPLFMALFVNGLVGFYAWKGLQRVYPEYRDMLHGFTYNGYTYIMAFVFFSVSSCLWFYHRFGKLAVSQLLVAPLFLWLCICGAIAFYLPGGSYFILAVFGLMGSLVVVMHQKEPHPLVLLFLALPTLWIFPSLIKMFPVALGLGLMISTTLMTTLTFFLLLPLFGFFKQKRMLSYITGILFFGFMVSAHINADFTPENPKPSSLLYVLNADTNTAQWSTYDHVPIPWNKNYLGSSFTKPKTNAYSLGSKYGTGYTFVADAPKKAIPLPDIEKIKDSVMGDMRVLAICVRPQRNVNRLEIYSNTTSILEASVNGIPLSSYYLEHRTSQKLITHYITDNEATELEVRIPKNEILELKLYEASNDLLSNPLFTIPPRPDNSIPMPFVVNDAILIEKTIRFE